MTLAEVVRIMRAAYGVRITKQCEEYRVTLVECLGPADTYFTNDLNDAIETGKRMREDSYAYRTN